MGQEASLKEGEWITEFGVFSRPHPHYRENGDGYLIQPHGEQAILIALIDALGHGPEAAEVSQLACDYLREASANYGIEELLRGCHRHLQGTRGAAVALAQVDRQSGRLRYCGVGNIEARLVGQTSARPISYNGIVGAVMPNFRCFEYSLAPSDMIMMHSDGISARFDLATYPDLSGQPVQLIADAIAREWSRQHDDATIVVARYTGGQA
jgi:serine phosphatase RsbU (regulator of sigma subunit)